MRLQLTLIFWIAVSGAAWAQHPVHPHDTVIKRISGEIEADFLMSYYQQDGDHSAVTGGSGTEKLQDLATVLVVNIPLDSSRSLMVKSGLTYYTSASNDNIDFQISSASRKEYRGDLEMALSQYQRHRGITRKYTIGASLDVDYLSTSIGYGWSRVWPGQDRQLSVEGRIYYDSWVWLVYPVEVRGTDGAQVPTNKRLTYNVALHYGWTINRRLQAALISDPTYQHGLLSTPFHRVYFADSSEVQIEKLPLDRYKLPLALRLHYFAGDFLTLRFYYRYYWDNFSIQAHTFNLEIPVKLVPSFTLFPYYRYHTQTAARYFQPFGQHLSTDRYFTSDFDLSQLRSHRYGLGLRLMPVGGLSRFQWSKKKATEVKGFELRASNYLRQDGLEAFNISAHVVFIIR